MAARRWVFSFCRCPTKIQRLRMCIGGNKSNKRTVMLFLDTCKRRFATSFAAKGVDNTTAVLSLGLGPSLLSSERNRVRSPEASSELIFRDSSSTNASRRRILLSSDLLIPRLAEGTCSWGNSWPMHRVPRRWQPSHFPSLRDQVHLFFRRLHSQQLRVPLRIFLLLTSGWAANDGASWAGDPESAMDGS